MPFDNLDNGIPLEGFGGQEPTQTEQDPVTENNPPIDEGGQGSETPPNDGTTVPEWQNEFGSPEELYAEYKKTQTSYKNLRPEYTKVTQELSALRKTATTPQGAAAQQTPSDNPVVDAVVQYVTKATAPIAELQMQVNVQNMMMQNPDFINIAPQVQEVLTESPELWNTANPLKIAYEIAKGRNVSAAVGSAITEARDSVYADKQLKVLGTGGKNPTKVETPPLSEDAQIAASILDANKRRNSIF